MTVLVLTSGTLALLAALIAHSKGRFALGWFLAGLLIGPFALIVAFLSPIVREGRYLQCPVCAEVVPEGARRCRYCSEEMP